MSFLLIGSEIEELLNSLKNLNSTLNEVKNSGKDTINDYIGQYQGNNEENNEDLNLSDTTPAKEKIHEIPYGSIKTNADAVFVGKSDGAWKNIDHDENSDVYKSDKFYKTTKTGHNKYGIYYEAMPSETGTVGLGRGEEDIGQYQADLNFAMLNTINHGKYSKVYSQDELYEALVANHALKKYSAFPDGIPVISCTKLIVGSS